MQLIYVALQVTPYLGSDQEHFASVYQIKNYLYILMVDIIHQHTSYSINLNYLPYM
jgi:hypothetical protein